MFKDSIAEGVKLLRHHEIWTALVVYALALLAKKYFAERIAEEKTVTGYFADMTGRGLLHCLVLPVIVGLLFPFFLGLKQTLPVEVLQAEFGALTSFGAIGAAVGAAISLLPGLNAVITRAPGFDDAIVAGIIFRGAAGKILPHLNLPAWAGQLTYPGLPEMAGYLALMGFAVWLPLFAASLWCRVTSQYDYEVEQKSIAARFYVGPTLGLLGGMTVFMMFTQWVRLGMGG